jgi:hypothetical protein
VVSSSQHDMTYIHFEQEFTLRIHCQRCLLEASVLFRSIWHLVSFILLTTNINIEIVAGSTFRCLSINN